MLDYERTNISETIDFLRKIKFFNEFSTLEMEKIHFFLQEKFLLENEVVYSQGDETDCLYLVKKGEIKVNSLLKRNPESVKKTMRIMGIKRTLEHLLT